MEGGESILDSIYEDDVSEDVNDVEMLDIEEGEYLEPNSQPELGQTSNGDIKVMDQEPKSKSGKRRNKRKRNKKKKSSLPNVTDINRFVVDTCRRLKEKKQYLVWNAVGCLGVSALSDLVKEVDAIMACGGQKTADGRRDRVGGGILWNILKAREPNAYREIMKKGREFEKQLRQQNVRQPMQQTKGAPSQRDASALTDQSSPCELDGSQPTPQLQSQPQHSDAKINRASARDRIRVPVSYDDDLLQDDHNNGVSNQEVLT